MLTTVVKTGTQENVPQFPRFNTSTYNKQNKQTNKILLFYSASRQTINRANSNPLL